MDKFKQLGTALTELRESRGFTQPEIATIAGVTAQTIYRVEKGSVKNPEIDTWKGICKAYFVSPAWVANQLGEQAPKRLQLLARQIESATEPAPAFTTLTDSTGTRTLFIKTEDAFRLGQLLGEGNIDAMIDYLQGIKKSHV